MSGQPWLESAELVGEKVLLRPVGPGDVDACFALIHGRDSITDWLVWDGPSSPAEIAPWYAHWPQLGESSPGCDYHFAIVDRLDGRFCGSIGLRFVGHEFIGDVGYWLAEEKWGRGMMTEALALVVWLAFERAGAVLMQAECFEGNEGSRIVLERNGFELDPLGETRIEKKGRPQVVHFYALSRTGWVAAGRRGEPRESRVRLGGERP